MAIRLPDTRYGQVHDKRGALINLAFHLDPAAMSFHQHLDQSQAKANPLALVVKRGSNAWTNRERKAMWLRVRMQ